MQFWLNWLIMILYGIWIWSLIRNLRVINYFYVIHEFTINWKRVLMSFFTDSNSLIY